MMKGNIMKVVIGNREIPINDDDLITARIAVNAFLLSLKNATIEQSKTSLYFTYLIYMYKKSKEILDAITPEALQYIMEMLLMSANKKNNHANNEINESD